MTNIHPPSNVPLAEAERAFFEAIIGELPRTAWTGHTMELAALLARFMAALEREQMALRAEGYIVTRPSTGTDVINPRSKGVSGLFSEVLALRRSLGIDGRSLGGEARDVARRRAGQKSNEIEAGDDLLAMHEG